jgi:hypothetical protein
VLTGVFGGCGGDGKKAASVPTTSATTQTAPPQTVPAPAAATPATPTTPAKPTPANPPPTTDTVPGGSEPARTELMFTATSAGINPRRAGVAPYVAVKVSLTSKDGTSHTLAIGGKTLRVGGTRKRAFVTLPGLRPGASYVGRADGRTTVRVLSTSEPGP